MGSRGGPIELGSTPKNPESQGEWFQRWCLKEGRLKKIDVFLESLWRGGREEEILYLIPKNAPTGRCFEDPYGVSPWDRSRVAKFEIPCKEPYYKFKKSWIILYSKLLYKLGQDFLNTKYALGDCYHFHDH